MVSEIVEDLLYVGDVLDGQSAHEHSVDYDRIVSVGGGCHENTTHCLLMKDDYGVDHSTFREAAGRVQSSLMAEKIVLVHCAVGASRAPSVAAAAMAVLDGSSFDEALDEIRDKRGSTRSGNLVHPHPALRGAAEKYVDEQS